MNLPPKLAESFSVIGLGNKVILNNKESVNESKIFKKNSHKLEKYITNLDIYYGYSANKPDQVSDNGISNDDVKWIDLDGSKTVWLKITYNLEAPAITFVDFVHIPIEKKKIVYFLKLFDITRKFLLLQIYFQLH
jgi:hypothetical protein